MEIIEHLEIYMHLLDLKMNINEKCNFKSMGQWHNWPQSVAQLVRVLQWNCVQWNIVLVCCYICVYH